MGGGAPLRQDSKVPVMPPSFQGCSLSAQVIELLALITPSPESERAAHELAMHAQDFIKDIFPRVEVSGFANGDVMRGTAFGVAVPELDIVATVSLEALSQQLQGRCSKLTPGRIDELKLQKSAIRACTDRLVSAGCFKFRRSAFRCQEPKVTLMAPGWGASGQGIPIDFSVNSVTPLCHATLMAECSKIDSRSRDLVLLVRRWAKDRGVCHVARGHLQPYAWTLLALFYLQVAVGTPLLPPLQGFKTEFGMEVRRGSRVNQEHESKDGSKALEPEVLASIARLTVGELFRGFVGFYHRSFRWHAEAVSVSAGQKTAPNPQLVPHMIVHDDGSSEAGLFIEDPFDLSRNVGSSLSSEGLRRLREELARTAELVSRGEEASLSDILAPWAPPDNVQTTNFAEAGDSPATDSATDRLGSSRESK